MAWQWKKWLGAGLLSSAALFVPSVLAQTDTGADTGTGSNSSSGDKMNQDPGTGGSGSMDSTKDMGQTIDKEKDKAAMPDSTMPKQKHHKAGSTGGSGSTPEPGSSGSSGTGTDSSGSPNP
jgi:hypothetical protein